MLIRANETLACYALVVAIWSLRVATVAAQPLGRTVVVPFFVGDTAHSALDLAGETDAVLRERRAELISLHDARDRFRARSRPPQTTSGSDIDALANEAHVAMKHVAFGRTAAAERSVRQIVELAERSLETLNRETSSARTLLDACLSLVRASLHDNKRDEAIQQAMHCRRLVPDLAPSAVAHPATVVGAFAEADDQLRRMRVGSLNVQVRPEQACDVYLNGRLLGHTPFSLDRAPAGEYRVQVECGSHHPGRVHVVRLGDEPTQLIVDSGFDETLRTEPRLALRYATSERARATLIEHAVIAGREVHAEDVLLVGLIDAQPTLLRVLVRHDRLVAGVAIPPPTSARISDAAELLEQARFDGVQPETFGTQRPGPQPTVGLGEAFPPQASPAATPVVAAVRAGATRTRWMPWVGATALILGVGSEVTSWFLYRARTREGEKLRESPSGHNDAWEDLRAPMLGVAAAGAGLGAAGVALLVLTSPKEKVPWWLAGSAASAGVGLAAWASVDVARSEVCAASDPRVCVDEEQRRDRGALLFTAAVPFLALAVTKIVGAARSSPKADQRRFAIAVTAQGLWASGSW